MKQTIGLMFFFAFVGACTTYKGVGAYHETPLNFKTATYVRVEKDDKPKTFRWGVYDCEKRDDKINCVKP